jgi:hypothetical protein
MKDPAAAIRLNETVPSLSMALHYRSVARVAGTRERVVWIVGSRSCVGGGLIGGIILLSFPKN